MCRIKHLGFVLFFAFKMGDLSRLVCERALLSGRERRTHFPGQEHKRLR